MSADEIAAPDRVDRPARGRTLPELEQDAIRRTLAEMGGNRRAAAEKSGIGLRTLYEKLKRYALE